MLDQRVSKKKLPLNERITETHCSQELQGHVKNTLMIAALTRQTSTFLFCIHEQQFSSLRKAQSSIAA